MSEAAEQAGNIAIYLHERQGADRVAEALARLIADCYASGHDDMLSMADARASLEAYLMARGA